jgi:hypothetical protein
MLKKGFLVLGVFSAGVVGVSTTLNNEVDTTIDQPAYIEDMKLASSRYTQVEDMSVVDEAFYIPIDDEDELITENATLRLYYDAEHVSFKVEDKDSGYVYATHIENANAGSYDGLLSSGIGIEYITVQKNMTIRENVGITDTVFIAEKEDIANGVKLSLNFGGFCATRNCERLYPDYLEGDYTKEQMIEFGLTEINISFDLEVTLTSDGLSAYIDQNSIIEANPEEILLSSIIVFPSFGATKMDDIPGYMMIPDGAGALVRYEDNNNAFLSPYQAPFYGENFGLTETRQTVNNYPLSMPIFGAVHGVNQFGFLGIVEEGDMSARLYMYPNGAHNLDYNLIFPKYDLRKVYRQSFSSDGSGGALRSVKTSNADIRVSYKLTKGDQANYAGLASMYRLYLQNEGVLGNKESFEDIPLHLTYLMSDSEQSFFGANVLEMTSVSDVFAMQEFFIDEGIKNYQISLMGWNDGGYSGHLPSNVDFERKLGSNSDYRDLFAYLLEYGEVSLINSYLAAGEESGVSYRSDVAKASNRFKMMYTCGNCVFEDNYILYPEITKELALRDLDDYLDEGVHVMFEGLGHALFSYYDGEQFMREDGFNIYQEIMSAYEGSAAYQYPYAYAYQYTNVFTDAPFYNSELQYFDDLVPILQIVLSQDMDLFSNYLNFNSYGKEQLLMLIDFHMNPSFILTEQKASMLKDTDIAYYFTTEFNLWKDTIVSQYDYVNEALKHVDSQGIVARTVLEAGLVKVTYSEGTIIYINYTSEDHMVDDGLVRAMDYLVGGAN